MIEMVALADEDIRRLLRQLSADVQASLALSRATLQAVASLSPALGEAVEAALEQELDMAREAKAAQQAVDHIEAARARVQEAPGQVETMSAMAHALIAAANALPDIPDEALADVRHS
ncbi:hypothetical protein [Phenylobacterium sp.]|uniref:hypothetical protein n=1 Tax=Phenylobacterium sp. TaxID=1871053 RepID=UPI0025F11394|nr:hypothetical protein [Phenylobacterium sp.]